MPTKIEWVKNPDGTQGHSWNPVTGCTKVSSGCAHCYAERMARRLAGRFGYPEAPYHFDVTLHPDRLDIPLKRKKSTMYFLPSMGDLFHKDVPFGFIWEVWKVMRACPQHTFQVLTKRSERMAEDVLMFYCAGQRPLPNVWLGVSVANQVVADARIPLLLQTPAAVRFVSAEPLLGGIGNLEPYLIDCKDCGNQGSDAYIRFEQSLCRACIKGGEGPGIDWIIVGGESGPGARPMDPQWMRDIRDQCIVAGTPFFFKGWGAWAHIPSDTKHPIPQKTHWWPDRNLMGRVGKKAAGRRLDGRTWNEMPHG